MEFLTPQFFNMLVVANLIVGLALIAYRFTKDMQRPLPPPQKRQQVYDESSTNALEDTAQHPAQRVADEESPAQNKQQT